MGIVKKQDGDWPATEAKHGPHTKERVYTKVNKNPKYCFCATLRLREENSWETCDIFRFSHISLHSQNLFYLIIKLIILLLDGIFPQIPLIKIVPFKKFLTLVKYGHKLPIIRLTMKQGHVHIEGERRIEWQSSTSLDKQKPTSCWYIVIRISLHSPSSRRCMEGKQRRVVPAIMMHGAIFFSIAQCFEPLFYFLIEASSWATRIKQGKKYAKIFFSHVAWMYQHFGKKLVHLYKEKGLKTTESSFFSVGPFSRIAVYK